MTTITLDYESGFTLDLERFPVANLHALSYIPLGLHAAPVGFGLRMTWLWRARWRRPRGWRGTASEPVDTKSQSG